MDMVDLLPNADKAVIDPRKLRDYALNPEHDSGRFKAAFFAQIKVLAGDLRDSCRVVFDP